MVHRFPEGRRTHGPTTLRRVGSHAGPPDSQGVLQRWLETRDAAPRARQSPTTTSIALVVRVWIDGVMYTTWATNVVPMGTSSVIGIVMLPVKGIGAIAGSTNRVRASGSHRRR